MTISGSGRGQEVSSPTGVPLISHERDQCSGCWGCVRQCPARALRVDGEHTEVIAERCVLCGACVTGCGAGAHAVRDDLPLVRKALASGVPVVALLASEHVAALHPRASSQTVETLLAIGFDDVETTVLGEEIVAAAYEQVHARVDSGFPRLRSTCPVATAWVRKFHPALTDALVPIVPPYVAQARLVRALREDDPVIVYVSPCWARKDEIHSAEIRGAVDIAIGFDELKLLLEGAPRRPEAVDARLRPPAAKQLSVTDGFPRRTLRAADLTNGDVVAVRGLTDIDRLLTGIVRGEVAPAVVDMLCCEGCIDGPAVNRDLSVFAKRNIDAADRERQPTPEIDSRTFLSALPSVDLMRRFEPAPARVREPEADEIDRVLEAGEFASRSDTIDCGACGYPTCVEHAAAIWLGNSSWDLCFPLMRKRLTRERERYEHASMTDELTGLLNRRAFDARLAEEVARTERYGTPFSLVMLDLDGFKEVNDRFGHAAGDAVLRSVGVLLNSEIRTTDHAVRYGGDEFALVLSGTAKTDAWAVAEKVRAALALLRVDAGDGRRVGTAASIGVASYGPDSGGAKALIEAADGALYRAKRKGRDRVELASG